MTHLKEACLAMEVLEDDKKWFGCLPKKLRNFKHDHNYNI
jgi:hypothetical protein